MMFIVTIFLIATISMIESYCISLGLREAAKNILRGRVCWIARIYVPNPKMMFKQTILRTRSIPTKANYKNKYRFELTCSLCKDQKCEENDAHLLSWSFVEGTFAAKTDLYKVKHDDIFKDTPRQIQGTKIYKEILKLMKPDEWENSPHWTHVSTFTDLL